MICRQASRPKLAISNGTRMRASQYYGSSLSFTATQLHCTIQLHSATQLPSNTLSFAATIQLHSNSASRHQRQKEDVHAMTTGIARTAGRCNPTSCMQLSNNSMCVWHAMKRNAAQYSAMQCNAAQRSARTQHNAAQRQRKAQCARQCTATNCSATAQSRQRMQAQNQMNAETTALPHHYG